MTSRTRCGRCCVRSGSSSSAPSRRLFATRARGLASVDAAISDIVEPLLAVLDAMGRQIECLTKRVRDGGTCGTDLPSVMTVPGVGPLDSARLPGNGRPARALPGSVTSALISALRHAATSPARPTSGRVRRCGDELARTALREGHAADALPEMVDAKGVGHARCPTARHGQGPRCRCAQAPHAHTGCGVIMPSPLGQGTGARSSMREVRTSSRLSKPGELSSPWGRWAR